MIVELVERADRERFVRSEADWAEARNRLRELLESPSTLTFVADEDGALVGELLAVREGRRARVGVTVAAHARRRGVATALFDALVGWASRSGVHEIRLEVREDNDAAIALYRRIGFVEAGRRAGEACTLLELALPIAPAGELSSQR